MAPSPQPPALPLCPLHPPPRAPLPPAAAPHVEAVLLAGGRGTRLGGCDKAALRLHGETFAERLRALLEPRVARVSLGLADGPPPAGWTRPVIRDRRPGCGPLAGLEAALAAARAPWVLALACDVPLVAPALLDALIARADATAADAVVPRGSRGFEPLCALYRRTLAARAAAWLDLGRRDVQGWLATIAVEPLPLTPDGEAGLLNVNTPDDVARLARLSEEGTVHHGGAGRGAEC